MCGTRFCPVVHPSLKVDPSVFQKTESNGSRSFHRHINKFDFKLIFVISVRYSSSTQRNRIWTQECQSIEKSQRCQRWPIERWKESNESSSSSRGTVRWGWWKENLSNPIITNIRMAWSKYWWIVCTFTELEQNSKLTSGDLPRYPQYIATQSIASSTSPCHGRNHQQQHSTATIFGPTRRNRTTWRWQNGWVVQDCLSGRPLNKWLDYLWQNNKSN